MSDLKITIFLIIAVFVIYLPIYLQRQKNWRIADEDLKKIDYEGWKRQLKSNVYINLISRLIWGLVLLSLVAFNLRQVIEYGFSWFTIFVIVLAVSSSAWGILGFRRDLRKFNERK